MDQDRFDVLTRLAAARDIARGADRTTRRGLGLLALAWLALSRPEAGDAKKNDGKKKSCKKNQ